MFYIIYYRVLSPKAFAYWNNSEPVPASSTTDCDTTATPFIIGNDVHWLWRKRKTAISDRTGICAMLGQPQLS